MVYRSTEIHVYYPPRQKTATLATVRRHPRISGYNHVRPDGLRAFEYGTEAFGFTAPLRLGCRESHTPWSAPRISMRPSPPVALTFYSRVTVYNAVPPNLSFHNHSSTVTLRYYVTGLFSLLTTYFRLLKTTVKTDIALFHAVHFRPPFTKVCTA